jgi:hypothetical protein
MYGNRGLITIAIGEKYAVQAKYLAYSCMIHVPAMIRSVITDKPDMLRSFYDIIIPYNPDYGDPFETKTRLHLYSPFKKTLYLDADSLVMNNIDLYWKFAKTGSFVYFGNKCTEGFWYNLDIKKWINEISVPWLPVFNSGMFLFDNSGISKDIFETAFYFFHHHENLKFPLFRGRMFPDEPFLAIALAKHNIEPVNDFGRFSRTTIKSKNIHIDVLKGIAFFYKDGKMVSPLVVHFCGRIGKQIYPREKVKLFFYFNTPLNSFLVYLCSSLVYLFFSIRILLFRIQRKIHFILSKT